MVFAFISVRGRAIMLTYPTQGCQIQFQWGSQIPVTRTRPPPPPPLRQIPELFLRQMFTHASCNVYQYHVLHLIRDTMIMNWWTRLWASDWSYSRMLAYST